MVDGGEIVERGRHEELLQRRGAYYRLYQQQFAPAEETESTPADTPEGATPTTA